MTEEKEVVVEDRPNKYLNDVTDIQTVCLNIKLENGVPRELTYQQALSVLLRSQQLVREGKMHPNRLSDEQMKRQIDICYEQRANG